MAINPMQKKVRNAFLLGVLIMLIISAVLGVLSYFLIFENTENKKEGIQRREVYIVSKEIKSGEILQNGINVKSIEIETSLSAGLIDGSEISNNAVARIDLSAGTILTKTMINNSDKITNDTRTIEYNMITLPTSVNIGDYIDVRLTLPSGQDFIVISKKRVENLNGDTLTLNLSEGDILIMNSAIVEAYIMKASNLYATKYVEPGNQEAATNTYRPTEAVVELIKANPNIVEKARENLNQFINSANAIILRQGYVDPQVGRYEAEALENIEQGILAQIEKAKQARASYLVNIEE